MDAETKKAVAANHAWWDGLVQHHVSSPHFDEYDVDKFVAGRSTLRPLDFEEVGDVRGKRLLHLQCHFGLDTLSWAREGALVTGVDFSEQAVAQAAELAERAGLNAEFVCADVQALPASLVGPFDVIYTSRGTICWFPDLKAWAKGIAERLTPEGFFYFYDGHPAIVLEPINGDPTSLRPAYPYFPTGHSVPETVEGSYATGNAGAPTEIHDWPHPFEEIFAALWAAGLQLTSLREFPFDFWPRWPFLVPDGQGQWHPPEGTYSLPLSFSLKAVRS